MIEIYDAVGRKVLQKTLRGNKNSLDISRQAAGMYTLKIKIGNEVHYTKIVVTK